MRAVAAGQWRRPLAAMWERLTGPYDSGQRAVDVATLVARSLAQPTVFAHAMANRWLAHAKAIWKASC